MSANKSVTKALKILELISKSEKGLTLSEIYKQVGLSKTTVYDILQALYLEDAVYFKDEVAKTYAVGSRLFQIGQTYMKNSNFIAFASPLLKEFAKKYGLTVFGCKRLGTKVTFVYKYESQSTRLATTDMGVQLSLNESVPGIAFLSFLKKEKSDSLIEQLNEENNGVVTEKMQYILNNLNKYREKGYVFDNGHFDSFVCDLAAPVYDFEGKMSGVIFATRFKMTSKDDIDEYINEFLEIAKEVSIKQGYQKAK